jgi:hypothetical protein
MLGKSRSRCDEPGTARRRMPYGAGVAGHQVRPRCETAARPGSGGGAASPERRGGRQASASPRPGRPPGCGRRPGSGSGRHRQPGQEVRSAADAVATHRSAAPGGRAAARPGSAPGRRGAGQRVLTARHAPDRLRLAGRFHSGWSRDRHASSSWFHVSVTLRSCRAASGRRGRHPPADAPLRSWLPVTASPPPAIRRTPDPLRRGRAQVRVVNAGVKGHTSGSISPTPAERPPAPNGAGRALLSPAPTTCGSTATTPRRPGSPARWGDPRQWRQRSARGRPPVVFLSTIPSVPGPVPRHFDRSSMQRVGEEINPAIRRLARERGLGLVDTYRAVPPPSRVAARRPPDRGRLPRHGAAVVRPAPAPRCADGRMSGVARSPRSSLARLSIALVAWRSPG